MPSNSTAPVAQGVDVDETPADASPPVPTPVANPPFAYHLVAPPSSPPPPEKPHYSPIGPRQIRLLEIEWTPYTCSDPYCVVPLNHVRASLQTFDLDAAPRYIALSYVWGSPADPQTIYIDGRSCLVSRNLFWALTRATIPILRTSLRRYADGPNIFIWADALCVNQDDLAERSLQVSLMGTVFRLAQYVLACFGDCPFPGMDHALVSNLFHLDKKWYTVPDRVDEEFVSWVKGLACSINELRRMPWWTRVWVVQEVALARTPIGIWGKWPFSYRLLIKAIEYLNRLSPTHFSRNERMLRFKNVHIVNVDWTNWPKTRLLKKYPDACVNLEPFSLLPYTYSLHCTDPRDRIYAFMGHPTIFSNSVWQQKVRPDYEIPYGELYTRVAEVFLQTNGAIYFGLVGSSKRGLRQINGEQPSWATQWWIKRTGRISSCTGLPRRIGICMRVPYGKGCKTLIRAGEGLGDDGPDPASKSSFEYDIDDGGNLSIQGACFDEIFKVWKISWLNTNDEPVAARAVRFTACNGNDGERAMTAEELCNLLSQTEGKSQENMSARSRYLAVAPGHVAQHFIPPHVVS